MAQPLDLSTLPEKVYFKIGEVAKLTGLKPYVLRYWEGEFDLKPHKSRSGQRLYQRKDIEQIARIKDLLYDKGMTIDGARRLLRRGDSEFEAQLAQDGESRDTTLLTVRRALVQLRQSLKQR